MRSWDWKRRAIERQHKLNHAKKQQTTDDGQSTMQPSTGQAPKQ